MNEWTKKEAAAKQFEMFFYFCFLDTLSHVEVKHELSKIDILGVNKLNYYISPFTDDPVGNVSGKTLLLLFV